MFGRAIRILIDQELSGAENMQRDEKLAQELIAGASDDATMRLYSWKPWCVSLGANQREDDIDRELLGSYGFDLVRRVTGGRSVLHARELTYSVVMRLTSGLSAADVYREIHERILAALQHVGATSLSFEKAQPKFGELYRSEVSSISCFTSSARHEIVWQGRKVVGSAQRLFGAVLLQHGSILLGNGHELLASVVRSKTEDSRDKLRETLLARSATMKELCGREPSFEECADALSTAFLKNEYARQTEAQRA